MKVHFITHSCFLVESDSCYLLFDYFEGALPKPASDKPLYVFASHSHPDHFSEEIFALSSKFRNVRFVLSHDIMKRYVPADLQPNTIFVHPNETYRLDALQIETLQSTDLGVAFIVECDGRTFYHAGDLNCWVWLGAPQADNDAMKVAYITQIGRLAMKKINVAFVPLDPRQEMYFDLGMSYFFAAADADCVFPMHMWDNYSVIPQFKAKYPQYADRIMDISHERSVFELP